MRIFTRLFVVLGLLTLTAGPVLALPAPGSLTPSLTAPASASPLAAPLGVVGWLLGVSALGITIRKDTGSLAKKYQQRAVAAAGDYKDGVANAGGDWETNTKNAEASFEAGVQEAIGDKRFGKGVTGSGGKYQTNAVNLGAQRYPAGVQNATDAWARGTQPYLDVLKGLQLPAPGPRRSAQNQQRANMVATALGAARKGR